MEENEVEEGEAYYDDSFLNPDVDFSYIDEKIQNLLGHFQKLFDGGISKDNLGAKFGGYGSFLPSHSTSAQTRSTPKPLISRPPFNKLAEVPHENCSGQKAMPVSKINTGSTIEPLEKLGEKAKCANALDAKDSNIHHGSNNKPVNGGEQKSMKFRIKVGSNNISSRNNAAAICTGLGLDVSPFSSPDDSPGHRGISPELQGLTHKSPSPSSILQMMTCCPLLGEYLLSPLPESLLHLVEKGSLNPINPSPVIQCKNTQDGQNFLGGRTPPIGDIENKMKSVGKSRVFTNVKNSNHKDCTSTFLKRDMDSETAEGRELVSGTLNIPLLTSCSTSNCVDAKTEVGQKLISDALKTPLLGLEGTENSMVKQQKRDKQRINESAKRTSKVFDINKDSNKIAPKNTLDLMGSSENNVAPLANETIHAKVKLCTKTGSSEKALQKGKTSSLKNSSCNDQREDSVKNENYDKSKGKKNHSVVPTESVKQKYISKATSQGQDVEMMSQGKSLLIEGKRKLKGNQTNGIPSTEFSKENKILDVSMPLKGKKIFQTRADNSESKPKALKSSKELCGRGEEFNKDRKHGNDNPKERPPGRSEAVVKEPILSPLISSPASVAVAAPDKDNWVACDICEKWRLFPYEINADDLPKKWKCKMQNWLPGLNKCSISEEETEKAFHALYQAPCPENGSHMNGHCDTTASASASAQHLRRNPEPPMSANGDKKFRLKDTPSLNPLTITKSSDPVKKTQRISIKSKSLIHAKESDPVNRLGFEQMSNSRNFSTQKQNVTEKDKRSRHSVEGGGINSKAGSKRVAAEDGSRVSKKIKTLGSPHPYEDLHLSSQDNMCAPNGKYLEKDRYSSHYSDSKDGIPAAKKRKVKGWEESQADQEVRAGSQHHHDSRVNIIDGFSESDPRKEKKGRVSELEAKEFSSNKADGTADRKGHATRILLSGSKKQYEGVPEREHQVAQCHVNVPPQQALDSNGCLKRDLSNLKPSVAADSSSSKVSDSCRSRTNFQEARGSPVESVSSSPLKIVKTEKHGAGKNCMNLKIRASYGRSNPDKNLQKSTSHNVGKSLIEPVLPRVDQSETISGRLTSESLPSRVEHEEHGQGHNSLHVPRKESRPQGAASNMAEQTKNLDNQNMASHNSLRHSTPDVIDARGPVRKSNQSNSNYALKEARDLKHTAERLKDEGLDIESTGLYFQAALKLLQAASLLEPSNAVLVQDEEATQLMRLYDEAARLCELCALAYERDKQMAAAALTYKCVEVAYFKVVYLKHFIASKDQQELQTALQMAIPGESSSSSASDVDNLNNLAKLYKSAPSKGVSGNYVIPARYGPTYTRLIDYTIDTIRAFEASKKARDSFASAIAGSEKENKGTASVKKVIEFSFYNVEELLSLIKQSLVHINC